MYFQKKILAVAITASVVMMSCNSDNEVDQQRVEATSSDVTQAAIDANNAIDLLAFTLSTTLTNEDNQMLRSFAASNELASDNNEILIGDFYDSSKNRAIIQNTSQSLVDLISSDANIESLVDQIPYASLYLYVPEGMTEFDSEKVLIAAAQYWGDAPEAEFINAYDQSGNVVILNNMEEPEFPVLVVGISEATMMKQSMAEQSVVEESVEESDVTNRSATNRSSSHCSNADGSVNHAEKMKTLRIYEDHEPWSAGDPEVYGLWAVGSNSGQSIRQSYGGVNDEDKTYTVNSTIFDYPNASSNMYYKVEFWEQDVNWGVDAKVVNGTYTYEDNGFDIKATFSGNGGFGNADDAMGATQMFYCHSASNYYTGDVRMYMYYTY